MRSGVVCEKSGPGIGTHTLTAGVLCPQARRMQEGELCTYVDWAA